MRPPDSIPTPQSWTGWYETLRQVARAANAAGLAGYQVAAVEMGLDRELAIEAIRSGGRDKIQAAARILITYQKGEC